jgi:hypothetical protein
LTDPGRIIACLNSMGIGEMEVLRAKLSEARAACRELDQPELADKLDEAGRALDAADLRTYRKRVETVIARLGHLR